MIKNKQALLINDFVSTSHVALNLQIDFLNNQQLQCVAIPSAIFSNTFNLGQPYNIDCSEYMEQSLAQYEALGIQFNGLLTGYLHNHKQVDLIKAWHKKHQDSLILVDPVMGDKGRMYQSLTKELALVYREMVSISDVMVPNLTEALLLSDEELDINKTEIEIHELLMKLHRLNNKSVLITSVEIGSESFIVGYDHRLDSMFKVKYEVIDGTYYGTGDLFSGALFYHLLKDKPLKEATELANENVSVRIMKQNALMSL